jgi:hypothetical protein
MFPAARVRILKAQPSIFCPGKSSTENKASFSLPSLHKYIIIQFRNAVVKSPPREIDYIRPESRKKPILRRKNVHVYPESAIPIPINDNQDEVATQSSSRLEPKAEWRDLFENRFLHFVPTGVGTPVEMTVGSHIPCLAKHVRKNVICHLLTSRLARN